MKLILIIFAIISLTILGFAQTPGDVVRLSKLGEPQVLDLRNTNPIVFNSSAFANQNPNPGHYNATDLILQQNEVGIPNSVVSFANGMPEFGYQNVAFKVDKNKPIIHGNIRNPGDTTTT